jgi:hypothetical protein
MTSEEREQSIEMTKDKFDKYKVNVHKDISHETLEEYENKIFGEYLIFKANASKKFIILVAESKVKQLDEKIKKIREGDK